MRTFYVNRYQSTLAILFLIATFVLTGCGGGQNATKKAEMPSAFWSEDSVRESLDESGEMAEAEGEAVEGGKKQKIKTWKRAETVPNTSRLMIGDEEELPLKGMQVAVRVDGFRARVVLDFHFYNDRNQQLEGTFQLRLPNEASPYFFAFGETRYQSPDVPVDRPVFFNVDSRNIRVSPDEIMLSRQETWTGPKEARMVPKDKASHAYHDTVRQRIDPALMEWAGAGVFNSRVFPIAPRKMHRIVIGYEVNLLPVGDDLVYQLDLPKEVSECQVDLSVATPQNLQTTISPSTEATAVGNRTYYHFKNPQEHIVLRLSSPGVFLLSGNDPKVGHEFFATRFQPQLPETKAELGSSHAVFLVDVSLSSNPDRFNIWLKLLKSTLEENRDSMQEFAVLFFNVETFWWKEQFVENTPENTEVLIQFCRRLALEGATDLGTALQVASAPAWMHDDSISNWDLFLFSDGAATWGEGDLHLISNIVKQSSVGALFAYTTGLAGTDSRTLQHLTRESGGAIFSIVGEAEVKKAATAHRQRPWQIVDVQVQGGSDLLFAGRPQTLFPNQNLLLVGRGNLEEDAQILLTVRRGDEERQIEQKVNFKLVSDLAPRIYGQVAVEQLEEFQSATEALSTAYACHFRVTGQTCSLLMLESEEDYQRYNIKPDEDAFVVKNNLAATQVQTTLEQLGEQLGDPKQQFLAWLQRMENMPGVTFQPSTALQLALKSLSKEAYAVSTPPLVCRQHQWQNIPGNLQEHLAAKTFTYDMLTEEANRRLQQTGPADALKALSSLVEKNPGDTVLLRDVAFSAMEWGQSGQAYHLLRRVARIRPYEPQTYWAMAQCLESLQRYDLAIAYYEVALAGQWDARFQDFATIVALDYLRFLRETLKKSNNLQLANFGAARLETVSKIYRLKESDLMITIGWNTDSTDVDLHVIEPSGEECYYRHPETRIGGKLTRDVTQGYGPEMYTLPKAVPGKYQVKVKYFASDQNRVSARTKVYVTIYRNWGRPSETVNRDVVTLKYGKEMHHLATITIK